MPSSSTPPGGPRPADPARTPHLGGASRSRAHDVAIVGAGFGGLSTALGLVERGRRVVLFEALGYPGGCAGTFERDGYRFEAGATLVSGLGPGGRFRELLDRHGLELDLEPLDPVIDFRAPGLTLAVPADRAQLVEHFASLPGAPADGVRRFFAEQARVADGLWSLFDDPSLLPPFGARGVARHARRLGAWARVARWAGRPLGAVLASFGVAGFRPLALYLDALCRITVQCSAAEAEAPFALAAIDYPFRGTAHVRGGVGELARALLEAVRAGGGDVRSPERVTRVEREGPGDSGGPGGSGDSAWRVRSAKSEARARSVVLNLLPQDARRLVGAEARGSRELERLARAVETGWGACTLYAVVCAPEGVVGPGPAHLQLVGDPDLPLQEGNHVFVSVGGEGERAPAGMRAITASTHVPLGELRAMPEAEAAEHTARVHERMRATIDALAPGLWANAVYELTGSPRTFERFTGRFAGYVGGVPRRAGLANYRRLVPRPVLPGLHLVGDSVFPGQSTLAAAVGGAKLAERLTARAEELSGAAANPDRGRGANRRPTWMPGISS